MATLVVMRHGQSVANRDNIFTGWSDVPLTALGERQAHQAGRVIAQTGIRFAAAHTSMLQRAIKSAVIILDECQQNAIPLTKSWRLNERHYGALRGQNKDVVAAKYGQEQVRSWRRGFTTVPPLLDHVDQDRRYDAINPHLEPRGESLAMASARLMPYWEDVVAPALLAGQNQLLVAHGSTLRALLKQLDQVSDDQIAQVEVGNGQPIVYEFDQALQVISKEVLQS